jgi:hypothetical protein
MKVFLSYRRSDVGGYAGRLNDVLVQRLGARNVFHDVSTIAPGRDFADVIQRALDDCDAALAVIGPGWSATTPEGSSRLHHADDYVRLELATALNHGLPVVPVLLGGAQLPPPDALPEDVRLLTRRQAVVLHDETWHQDVDGLLRSLRGEVEGPVEQPNRRKRVVAALGAGVAVLAGATLAVSQLSGEPGDSSDGEVVAACVTPGETWTSLPLNARATVEAPVGNGMLTYTVRTARWREIEPGQWQVTLDTSMENRTESELYHGDWLYESLLVGQRAFDKTCFSSFPDLVIPGAVGDALIGYETRCMPAGSIELAVDDAPGRIRVTDATEPAPC